MRYATFTIDGTSYGVDVLQVQEALRAPRRTRVPLSPPGISGLVNLRGQVVLTIDLRHRFALPPATDPDANQMMVVLQVGGEPTGLLVDSVGDVVDVPDDLAGPPPDTLDPAMRSLVRGACRLPDRLLLVLDVAEAVA
jgi:purine-binding chemotaxis protein CheW